MSQFADELSKENEEFTFGIAVMKKQPKPNAQSYHIKTIDDIFQIITPKNIDKFFLEFKEMMEVNMHLKTALNADGDINFKSFDWIDD